MLKLAGSSLNSYFVHYSFEKGKEAVMNYHCKKEVRKGGTVLKLSEPEVECGREAKPWLFCFLFLCPVCFLLTLLLPNPTSPTPSCPSAWTCTQHWGNYSSACSGKWAKGISLSPACGMHTNESSPQLCCQATWKIKMCSWHSLWNSNIFLLLYIL